MTSTCRSPVPNKVAELSDLFESISIGRAVASNRIAMAPMTNKQSNADGTLADAEIDWLVQRARGGFATVITGAWAIAPEGRVWRGQASIYTDAQAEALVPLGERMREAGSVGIVQLIHGGSRYSPHESQTDRGVSASGGDNWRAATDSDIERLIEAHRTAALRVEAAGLSGVEVHAAHGFLPAQFISRTGNVRTDGWGGPLVQRARFVRHVVRAIRQAVSPGFVVGVRLSPEDHRHGIVLHETAEIAGWLAEDGADYIHLSLGDAFATSEVDPAVHPLTAIREAVPRRVRIVAAGGIRNPNDARQVLRLGADVVALGTAAILDPDWASRAQDSAWTPAKPPFSRDEMGRVGVTDPLFEYLNEGWPDLIAQSPTNG
jgi:2,4-dienoyl-CoA reductase-like NADH-dependent reductase (Old Yellow Enzyme family)